MTRHHRSGWRLVLGLALAFVVLTPLAHPVWAQQSETEDPTEQAAQVAPADSQSFEMASDRNVSADNLPMLLVPLTVDELADVAVTWQGYLREDLEAVVSENIALRQASDDATENLHRQRLTDLAIDQSSVQEKYLLVLDAWEMKGAAPEDVQAHRDYLMALAAGAVRNIDPQTLFRISWDWLTSPDGGLGVLMLVAGFLVAGWVMLLLARIARRMAERGLNRVPGLSRLLTSFVLKAVFWATFAVGLMTFLAVIGVNVTPLFAVFGGLSFILGFALQDTLSNLASGLMIMVLKPFDIGDYIQSAGVSGTVDEMTIVSTRIRTFDNQVIMVPNSKIWGDVITNVNASRTRRVDLVFGIGYSDDAAQAIEVLRDLVEAHDLCLKDPEPEIFVGELGDNSVNIFCRPWSLSDDYWTVWWDLTGQAKERFDAEGISIPFPQRDVHLHHVAPIPIAVDRDGETGKNPAEST